MLLHVEESGEGDDVVVLLHGMMGSARSWWRVTHLLVEDGHRVLALDLPALPATAASPCRGRRMRWLTPLIGLRPAACPRS